MGLNRNQYILVAFIALMLGCQFRYVKEYVLTDETARFVAVKLKKLPKSAISSEGKPDLPASVRTWKPPQWLCWACFSVGGVLLSHAIVLEKPN